MIRSSCRWMIVVLTVGCIVMTIAAERLPAGQDPPQTRQASGIEPNRELLDLIRRTQDLAEQAQVELRLSREQNASLQQLLEQTRRELAELQQTVRQLRSSARLSEEPQVAAAPSKKAGSALDSESGEAAKVSADRLSRMEDQIEINTAQIKEHDQTKVESDSRFKVKLFGTILNNTYYNTSDSSAEAVPTAAPPHASQEQNSSGNLGSTLRQTILGFAMTGPKLGNARLSADVDFDFFGGSHAGYEGNALGTLRMRTATARIEGPRSSLATGLMGPAISPLSPTSLAAVYYPALGESGNLWQWLPQVVASRRTPITDQSDLLIQGGLMMPFGETISGVGLEGRPGYESRIAFIRRLDTERRLMIGAGGYYHPQYFGFGRSVDSYAATSDWIIPLHRRLELSGEVFYGQSITLSEQSGGDVGSFYALSGPFGSASTTIHGIHSAGGWAQLRAKASPTLDFNFAYGIDDPRNRDVFAGLFDSTTRLGNRTFSVNSIFQLRSNFVLSLEYRRMWTTYPGEQSTSDHINLAIGYLF